MSVGVHLSYYNMLSDQIETAQSIANEVQYSVLAQALSLFSNILMRQSGIHFSHSNIKKENALIFNNI